MQLARLAFVCALALAPAASAQPRVDAFNMHERIIAVVPIIGAGTYEDPHRPLFAPQPATTVNGLISWSWGPSDDGKFAIVEFVAKEKSALKTIAADARVVKSFEKGKAKLEEVERELRKYRRDYTLRKAVRRAE